MTDSTREYGRKAFYVRLKDIVRFFEAAGRPDNWLPVPRIKGLPEGYTVECVTRDELRNCFVFVLGHPAWPATAEFSAPPEIEAAEWEVVKLDPGGFQAKYQKAASDADVHEKLYLDSVKAIKDLATSRREVTDHRDRIARHPFRYGFRKFFGLED